MEDKELPTVSLNAPAAPVSEETKTLAHGYLRALGQGVEKAFEDAERLGHNFIVAHYRAGTDPYEEERAAAKASAIGSVETGAASEGTSTPAAPTAAPGLNLNDKLESMIDRFNTIKEGDDVPPVMIEAVDHVRQLLDRIDRLEMWASELQRSFDAHVDANHLAAHPLPPAAEPPLVTPAVMQGDTVAQSLDAVEAEKKVAADTASETPPNVNEQ